MLDVIVLFAVSVINMMFGLLVFLRNPRQKTNIAYLFVSIFVTAWAVTNYLAGSPHVALALNDLGNRLAYVFGFFGILSCSWFVTNFPASIRLERKRTLLALVWCVAVGLSGLSPYVAGEASRDDLLIPHYSTGVLLPIYVLTLLMVVVFIVRRLARVYRQTRGRERQQVIYVLTGFTIPIVAGLLTNVVLPSLTGNWRVASVGPVFTIIMVAILGYAIVRHRLFDLRLAVARSLGYGLSFLVMMFFYVLAAFALANFALDLNITVGKAFLLAGVSVLVGLLFPMVKRVFDRISNRLFFREAYDSQDLLDKISGLLVGAVDTEAIIKESTLILGDIFKSSRVAFLLQFTEKETDKEKLLSLLHNEGQALVDTDELDRSKAHALYHAMTDEGASLAIKLHTSHDELGYLLFGYRRSGMGYTILDKRVLGVVADELAIGLQSALRFQEIQGFNTTLQDKVADATRKLRRTNEKLRQMDETKDDFISMASHQLRTPLTSIKGYLSMVLEGDMGELRPAQKQALDQALVSSQRMVFLIADLLNLSRLKTGKFVIEAVPTRLAELIEGEVNQLQETAKVRDLELTYQKPASFPVLMLDETKIRQVVMNFMDNSIYYTHAGGHITIELKETEKTVEFTVKDDGIGVPKHEQHHLFNKFYRAGNARKARPDGTGLGLFMAKKVIVAQGGSIIFRSQEGKGSTFGFSFAKARVLAPPNAHPVARESNPLAAAEKSLNS